jgi:hypothetical protein
VDEFGDEKCVRWMRDRVVPCAIQTVLQKVRPALQVCVGVCSDYDELLEKLLEYPACTLVKGTMEQLEQAVPEEARTVVSLQPHGCMQLNLMESRFRCDSVLLD